MQLQSVRIKNFKGIDEKKITCKPGVDLIKGANSTGKNLIFKEDLLNERYQK